MKPALLSRVACFVAAACSAGPHPGGLAPDAVPTLPLSVSSDGRFSGAALGWSLGGEVHLYVTDTTFSRHVFERLIRRRLLHDAAPIDSAFARHRVLSLNADSLSRVMRDSVDATILAESGAVPAQLSLIRLHAPGACTEGGPVTELVYRFRREDLGAGPRAHTVVVGLLQPIGSAPTVFPLVPPPGTVRAQTLVVVTALAGSRATTQGPIPDEALVAFPALDADREDDAGEAIAIGAADPSTPPRVAVAVRARFAAHGDTSLISGVALTDGAQSIVGWVVAPVRASLSARSPSHGAGVRSRRRYVLHGRVVFPPSGALLLVDQIDDVRARASRILVIDPASGRMLATQPLALNCRDR